MQILDDPQFVYNIATLTRRNQTKGQGKTTTCELALSNTTHSVKILYSQFKRTGARFSKVPKLFGRNSGDIIRFVSPKRRRIEARNFAVIFIFIPFTTYEKTSFTE